VCAAVVWGAWIRVETALADPNFDAQRPEGMLRSDPALLYYITEELVHSLGSGALPEDFRADPRIQHPDLTDVPAEFGVGQEFLVAGARVLFPSQRPLHVFCLQVTSFLAALFVVGVFVAVLAVTRSDLWASLAVLLALVTPANYRTIGFILVREDLALPLFALHLAWLARAMRTHRVPDFLGSGLVLAGALSTWHALGFVVLLELCLVWAGFLWTARSPFETPASTYVLVFPVLAGPSVPCLRLAGWLYSPAVALALGLWAVACACRVRPLARAQRRWLGLGVSAAWFLATRPLAPHAYDHVYQVLLAKLRYLGRLPSDPDALSFDARLLWQGPFETLAPGDLLAWLGWPLVALLLIVAAVQVRARLACGGFELLLAGLCAVSLPIAWLFGRLAVLPGLLAPMCAVLALARWRRQGAALSVAGVLVLVQGGSFLSFVNELRSTWYLPREARDELSALIAWVRENVPEDEAIAADFLNSTAILAHTRRPIVLQPKYETEASRRKAEAFLTTLFQGTAEELRRLLLERFSCHYVLFDRYALWDLSRTTAGLREDERAPRRGTAAEVFLGTEPELASVPGFELVYRSSQGGRCADFRLYRLR